MNKFPSIAKLAFHEWCENTPFSTQQNNFTCAIARVANSAKANREMMAHNEKSIICNEPPVGALHSGKTLTPPLSLSVDTGKTADFNAFNKLLKENF